MTAAPTLLPEVEKRAETRARPRVAPRWKVILQNDDITTFEFVIDMLVRIFHKSSRESVRLTHEVHEKGGAVVEITSLERAELYVEQVRSTARASGFPLCATLEPE